MWHLLISSYFWGVFQMIKEEVNFSCRWNRMGERKGDNSVKEVGQTGKNVLQGEKERWRWGRRGCRGDEEM